MKKLLLIVCLALVFCDQLFARGAGEHGGTAPTITEAPPPVMPQADASLQVTGDPSLSASPQLQPGPLERAWSMTGLFRWFQNFPAGNSLQSFLALLVAIGLIFLGIRAARSTEILVPLGIGLLFSLLPIEAFRTLGDASRSIFDSELPVTALLLGFGLSICGAAPRPVRTTIAILAATTMFFLFMLIMSSGIFALETKGVFAAVATGASAPLSVFAVGKVSPILLAVAMMIFGISRLAEPPLSTVDLDGASSEAEFKAKILFLSLSVFLVALLIPDVAATALFFLAGAMLNVLAGKKSRAFSDAAGVLTLGSIAFLAGAAFLPDQLAQSWLLLVVAGLVALPQLFLRLHALEKVLVSFGLLAVLQVIIYWPM